VLSPRGDADAISNAHLSFLPVHDHDTPTFDDMVKLAGMMMEVERRCGAWIHLNKGKPETSETGRCPGEFEHGAVALIPHACCLGKIADARIHSGLPFGL